MKFFLEVTDQNARIVIEEEDISLLTTQLENFYLNDDISCIDRSPHMAQSIQEENTLLFRSIFPKNREQNNLTDQPSKEFKKRWKIILKDHKVSNLIASFKQELQSSGFIFDRHDLKEIYDYFINSNQKKFKKNDKIAYSVIKDQNGSLYAIYGTINNDSNGKVYLVQSLTTKALCALKIVEGTSFDEESLILTKRKLLLGTQNRVTEKGKNKIYLFMKLVSGVTLYDFYHLLKENNMKLSKEEQTQFLVSILQALLDIIRDNICHCDLHHENIMIDPLSWQSTIIDFGSAFLTSSLPLAKQEYFYYQDLKRLLSHNAIKKIITNPELREVMAKLQQSENNIVDNLSLSIMKLRSYTQPSRQHAKL